MAVLRSGPSRPEPDPLIIGLYEAMIESLGLATTPSWAARALSVCLRSLARDAPMVTVVDAALRGDESFVVTYRRPARDWPVDCVLGTVGDRDPEATLLLMPHFEEADVPLDPETYGGHFSIVGVQEPFGPEHYSQPDEAGVRWFNPPDFRSR